MKTSRLLGRVIAVLVAAALALTFSPAATRPAHAAPTITLISAHTVKPVGQPITVTAQVSETASAVCYVRGQVLLADGWRNDDSLELTDSFGRVTLTLTYRASEPGVFTYQLLMYGCNYGDVVTTAPFQIQRTPIVTLRSAPAVSPAGTTITARSRVQPIYAGVGFTEVYTPTRGWLRSQQTSINTGTGEFTLPLTYGATTPGTYLWRVGATINGATGRSATFTIVRTPSVQLRSASAVATRGVLTYARGRTYSMRPGYTGFAQVWYANRWATISTAPTTATGDFYAPLKYGVNSAGINTFRLGATINGTRYYTPAFNVTRS